MTQTGVVPVEFTAATSERKFNDDLLINDGDLQYAKEQFPEVFHLLDHPELREKFRAYETTANKARGYVHILGLLAVVCATVALMSIAVGPFFHGMVHEKMLSTLFELLLMIAAVIAGMSLLVGPWRKRWLEARFMTERLRQWHFQGPVRRGGEVEASCDHANPKAIQTFQEQRRRWFADFLQEHVGKEDSRLALLANDPDDFSSDWLLDSKTEYSAASETLHRVCEAYYRLRVKHQLDYATHKLAEDRDKPHWRFLSWPILRQESSLHSVVSFCFYAALICSIAMIINQWTGFRPHYASHLGSIALMVAIVGVAFRTIQDGLGISKDIERYRDYRGKVRRLRQAFETAPNPSQRLKIMEELELETVNELRGFLRTHRDAAFVL
jgi:hypothetical protein